MQTKKPLGVSVIMPTLNEAGNIRDLINETGHVLEAGGYEDFELIVVDDDSPDQTWKIAGEMAKNQAGRIKVLRRVHKHGLTLSISDGIQASTHEVVVWMDCDFSHPPEKIPQMLYMIGEGYDIVVNSRYIIGGGEDRVGKGGPLQLMLSRLLNWVIRFLLTPSFSDYTSGFIAVRRHVLDEIPLRGDYGEYFVDFIYRAIRRKSYRVCELPYTAMPRRSGESKTGSNIFQYFKRGWKYIWVVVKLRTGLGVT